MTERAASKLFWLHIKKSAGISTRVMLGDAYVTVDRTNRPATFIQSDNAAWNDILNNYRVPLGGYQFRRAAFAKKYLYPGDWNDHLRFAFSREPVSRAVSMFHYLFWRGDSLRNALVDNLTILKHRKKAVFRTAVAFDLFLDVLDARFAPDNKSNNSPFNLHFTTHTARMFDDVAGDDGEILLNRIYRLESLKPAIAEVLSDIGATTPSPPHRDRQNVNRETQVYQPSPAQRTRIEQIYAADFELYENAIIR